MSDGGRVSGRGHDRGMDGTDEDVDGQGLRL